MSDLYVFDACSLIAVLSNEEGADVVKNLLQRAVDNEIKILMNKVNFLEVYNRVALSANTPSLSSRDFAVTIDGSSVTLGGSEQNHGSNPYIQLNFTSPRLTVGTRYAVTVVYNGSAITAFTRSETLTCQAD